MAYLNTSHDQIVKINYDVSRETVWTMLDDLGKEEDVDIFGDSIPLTSSMDSCEIYKRKPVEYSSDQKIGFFSQGLANE